MFHIYYTRIRGPAGENINALVGRFNLVKVML